MKAEQLLPAGSVGILNSEIVAAGVFHAMRHTNIRYGQPMLWWEWRQLPSDTGGTWMPYPDGVEPDGWFACSDHEIAGPFGVLHAVVCVSQRFADLMELRERNREAAAPELKRRKDLVWPAMVEWSEMCGKAWPEIPKPEVQPKG